MKYTNEQIIARIERTEKLAKLGQLTHITDKSQLSAQDKMKIGLCKHFVMFINSKRMKLKDVAAMIDIPVTRLSEIANYKIKKFSVDQLVKNLAVLGEHDAAIKEFVLLLVNTTELPALNLKETRKLNRGIKEASKLNQASV